MVHQQCTSKPSIYLSMNFPLSYKLTESRRNHLFISARNQHVKRQLMMHYAAKSPTRKIAIFCVSNKLYREACNQKSRIELSMQNRRRSSNLTERNSAANQMLASSGICELRDYCQGIPSSSQIKETRHFLNTRLVKLLEKTEIWLTASVAGVAANQQAAPGFLGELQAELKNVSFLDSRN